MARWIQSDLLWWEAIRFVRTSWGYHRADEPSRSLEVQAFQVVCCLFSVSKRIALEQRLIPNYASSGTWKMCSRICLYLCQITIMRKEPSEIRRRENVLMVAMTTRMIRRLVGYSFSGPETPMRASHQSSLSRLRTCSLWRAAKSRQKTVVVFYQAAQRHSARILFWKHVRIAGSSSGAHRWWYPIIDSASRIRFRCLDCSNGTPFSQVSLYGCHQMRGNQLWEYTKSKRIVHTLTGRCLQSHTVHGVRCDDFEDLVEI